MAALREKFGAAGATADARRAQAVVRVEVT